MHEVSKKIDLIIPRLKKTGLMTSDLENIDFIIVRFLREKAEEIEAFKDVPKLNVKAILGIYDGNNKPVVINTGQHTRVEGVVGDGWCEHIKQKEEGLHIPHPWSEGSWIVNADYKFCPICGTPRPKTLSKVERLARKLLDAVPGIMVTNTALALADIAIDFCEGEK